MNSFKSYFKKVVSICLTLALLLSLVPVNSFAKEDGTTEKEITLTPITLSIGEYYQLNSFNLIDHITDESLRAIAQENWRSSISLTNCVYDSSYLSTGVYYELLAEHADGQLKFLYSGINITKDEANLYESEATLKDGSKLTYVEEGEGIAPYTLRPLIAGETTLTATNVYVEGYGDNVPVYTVNIPIIITEGTLTHQVLFVKNNVVEKMESVEDGNAAVAPNFTVAKGHHSEWSKDFTAVTSNLVAHWSDAVNHYNVVYDANGGTGTVAKSSNLEYDKSYKLTPNSFKYKGYTFAGWNTKANGLGRSYKDMASVKNMTAKDNFTIKLYAQWKANEYQITYYLNGGINAKKNPATYTITNKTITLATPTRKGYKFAGWYKDSKFKTSITKIESGSTGNLKLYAKWKK